MKSSPNFFGLTTAIVVLALFSSTASAQPEGKRGPGKGGPGKGAQFKGKPGQAPQGRPEGRGPRNPEEMVKRMIAQFDKDGDQKLDAKELMALLTQMRQRGPQGRPGQGAPGRGPGAGGFGPGKGGPGKGGAGKGGPGGRGPGGQGKGGPGGKGPGGQGKGRPDFQE